MVEEERCLFRLSSGLLGTGPLYLANGDHVFLLPGVYTPIAVREDGPGRNAVAGPVHAPCVMHSKKSYNRGLINVVLV